MEGDTIRTSGTDTLIDLWLIDRVRPLCVTRDAIAACVGSQAADAMNEVDRCEFVRARLPLIMKAARLAMDSGAMDGNTVIVDGSALLDDGTMGERRQSDRRRGERRRVARPGETLKPVGERRKNDRRRSERRRAGPGKLTRT